MSSDQGIRIFGDVDVCTRGAKTARCARPKYCVCVVRAHMPYCTPRSGSIVRITKNTYPRGFSFGNKRVLPGLILTKPTHQSQRNDMLGSPAEALFEVALLLRQHFKLTEAQSPETTCTYRFSIGNLCRACAEPLVPLTAQTGFRCYMGSCSTGRRYQKLVKKFSLFLFLPAGFFFFPFPFVPDARRKVRT